MPPGYMFFGAPTSNESVDFAEDAYHFRQKREALIAQIDDQIRNKPGILNVLAYDEAISQKQMEAISCIPTHLGRFILQQIPLVNIAYALYTLSKDSAGIVVMEYSRSFADALSSSITVSRTVTNQTISDIQNTSLMDSACLPLGVLSVASSIVMVISSTLALISAAKRDAFYNDLTKKLQNDFNTASQTFKNTLIKKESDALLKKTPSEQQALDELMTISRKKAKLILLNRQNSFVKRHIFDGTLTIDLKQLDIEKLAILLGKLDQDKDALLIKSTVEALNAMIETYPEDDNAREKVRNHVAGLMGKSALTRVGKTVRKAKERAELLVTLKTIGLVFAAINLIAVSLLFAAVTFGIGPIAVVGLLAVATIALSSTKLLLNFIMNRLEPKNAMPKVEASLSHINDCRTELGVDRDMNIQKMSAEVQTVPALYGWHQKEVNQAANTQSTLPATRLVTAAASTHD